MDYLGKKFLFGGIFFILFSFLPGDAPDVTAGVVNLGDELTPFLKHGNHVTNQTFVARG